MYTSNLRNLSDGRRILKADMRKVLLDQISDGCQQAGDVFSVHPGAATRIENGLQLLNDEGDVSSPPENRADHSRKCNRPSVMCEVLGIDEDFKGATPVFIDSVVDCHINSVV